MTKQAMAVLVERLAAKIVEQKTNSRAVSRAAGLADTYCHDVLTGRNTTPSLYAIQQLARVLQTTLAFLTGESDDSPDPQVKRMDQMPVLATAETGAARPVSTVKDAPYPTIEAPRSRRHLDAAHFAIRIADDSMTSLLPGMLALCIDMKPAGLIVESNRLYCVRRTLTGGKTWETLIRRAEVFRDRTLLWADTPSPEHKNPIVVTRTVPVVQAMPWQSTRHGVCVFGLVYGAMFAFE